MWSTLDPLWRSAPHNPKDQSGGAEIAAAGIVNHLSESNLPMGRDLDSATLSILDRGNEQALDALSNRRLFAVWKRFSEHSYQALPRPATLSDACEKSEFRGLRSLAGVPS